MNDVISKDKPIIVGGEMLTLDTMSQLCSSPSSARIARQVERSHTYGVVTRDIEFRCLAKVVAQDNTKFSKILVKSVHILNNPILNHMVSDVGS